MIKEEEVEEIGVEREGGNDENEKKKEEKEEEEQKKGLIFFFLGDYFKLNYFAHFSIISNKSLTIMKECCM